MNDNLKAAIRLQNVNYYADNLHILKNITDSFIKGKITTLVGPSGAGKSTLFRLCTGLKSPNSGDLFINDKHITEYKPTDLRRTVGLALQNAPMISGTVMANLELPLILQGGKLLKENAIELLHLVGLEERFLHHKVNELSGGQKQKVSIARTLVNRPDVLLLDEITSSLDRISQQDIEDLILRINKKYQTTIVWITHNLEQAFKIGHYSWVMMNGEVIETGETTFLKNPKDERVASFVRGEEN